MLTTVRSGPARVAVAALFVATLAGACRSDPETTKQRHLVRGREYVAQEKYSEAIIELRNAVQIDGGFGEARYELAEAYARSGNADAAFREYVRAADLLPDPKVQLKAAMLLLLSGRYDEARARAEKVVAADPRNIEAQILLGNALAGLKDFDGAVAQMQQAIKADPNPGLTYATLGNFELQRGRLPDAEVAYAKAIEIDPSSASARVALGNYRLAVGDRPQAEAAFLKAVELDPANVIALRAIVTMYLTAQQFDRAEPFLVRLAQAAPESTPSFVLADIYAGTKRTPLAIERLQTLQKTPADFVPATLRLAAIDYAAGRKTDAYAKVEEAIKASPKAPQGFVLKGRFLMADQNLAEAVTVLRSAATASPEYASAHYWLALALLRQGELDAARTAFTDTLRLAPSFVPAQVALSNIHLRQREADQALTYATQAVKGAPRDPDARAALVWALIARGDAERATAELETLAAQQPSLAAVHVLRGALGTLRKNPAEAERAFARARELDPASHDALNGLVATQLASGNVAAAQAEVDAALTKSPESAATLLVAARTHLATRDFAAAERELRKVVDLDPDRLEAYSLLGRLYATQQRLDEAIGEFDALATRQPKSVGAHTAVATLQLVLNRRTEARARYEKVLDIDPNAAVAANNLAWLYAEDGGNLDVALQLAKTAAARLPESAEVSDTLGFVHQKKEQYPQAIAAFQSSVRLDPKNPIYHYHLGLAYAARGDSAGARQSLDTALKLNPTFAGADTARATLAGLR